ncbi:oxidoreductase [Lophiotrema nucula]|uniref:Oxidoreductase n=1 Tax=Lophiotrema nucula TaxID=690887 RepID=A0A6A5Z0B6_9PLEO|nr:oxidoreductase [Lophiotrema nucula]
MSFPYKHVLLIGATSGIGAALANTFIAHNIKVTAVGRRADRLEAFVSQHGPELASSMVFDISNVSKASSFAAQALKSYPTIDCLFLNAGMVRWYNFAEPKSVDIGGFFEEMNTNFTALVALTYAFLPYFLEAKGERSIVYTGTHIGIVPAASMPAYSASKAALDSFTMCLRQQLSVTNTKVIYVSPPLVQSELHDVQMGEKGRKMGMPADEFAEATYSELTKGTENVIIGTIGGSSVEQFVEIVDKREEAFQRLVELLKTLH